ncbi:MAG TPA: sugar phosphate isomerase/epimerase family protein, partial [Bryobacterales bacterium]|nr:sugar phosphate isomerase/epimerase family protein [Bryobacterales bacterium]
ESCRAYQRYPRPVGDCMTYTRREILAASAMASLGRHLPAATLAQIRLGVTTDEIDEDVLTATRFLRKFGLSYAEVRSMGGKYNTSQPPEKVREAQAVFQEYGVQVSVLDTAFFKIPLPADTAEGRRTLEEQWKLLDAAMERAKIFRTKKIRVFAFTREKGEQSEKSAYPRIYELVREAARRAKAQNFRLALENVGGSYVATGAESAELLKAVPDHTLGLNWDPNNAGASGEQAFPDGYRRLDPARIIHVHLRDYRHRPGGKAEWCAVGEGEMDNLGQLRALLKDGYQGTFTLETHWRSPKGKAYSTETSLTALLKVIREV